MDDFNIHVEPLIPQTTYLSKKVDASCKCYFCCFCIIICCFLVLLVIRHG